MGQASEREDAVAAKIAADPSAPLFLISTRSEEEIRSGFAWAYWGWLLLGTLLLVGSFLWRDAVQGRDSGREWPFYVLAVLGFYCSATVGWVWMVFNGLIDLRQRVRQAWAQVDV
ncbi:MAG: LemA domain-containing protein, partial [Verrucomicrobia bacterium]|nr:LemA domain-containing protein [Verrucomicrobiota bacterium]